MNSSKEQSSQVKTERTKSPPETVKPEAVSGTTQQILAPKKSKPNVMQSSSWMSITGK